MNGDMHTLIIGDSGTGKTTNARHRFVESQRLNVFLNTQGEDIPGYEVEGRYPTLRELVQHRKVVVNDDQPARMVAGFPDFIDKVFAFGRRVAPGPVNRKAPFLNVHVDECWKYEGNNPAPGEETLSRITAQGYRHGVVGIFITQRPQPVSKGCVRLARQRIVYRLPPEDLEYVERLCGEPLGEADKAWLQRDFHFLVHSPRGWTPEEPVNP